MNNYAMHDGERVLDVIIAETAELAEALTGLTAVAVTASGPGIGWTLDAAGWRSPDPSPYPSWTWDYTTGGYVSPVLYPGDGAVYWWDEEQGDWVKFTPPSPRGE